MMVGRYIETQPSTFLLFFLVYIILSHLLLLHGVLDSSVVVALGVNLKLSTLPQFRCSPWLLYLPRIPILHTVGIY